MRSKIAAMIQDLATPVNTKLKLIPIFSCHFWPAFINELIHYFAQLQQSSHSEAHRFTCRNLKSTNNKIKFGRCSFVINSGSCTSILKAFCCYKSSFLSSVFILTLLCINTDDESRALLEIIGRAIILLLTASLCYGVAYREKRFNKYQFLSMLMTAVLTFLLVAVPASLYMILAVYNLLPTTLIGFFVAIVQLTANVLLFQTRKSFNNEVDISLIMADVELYFTANVVGIFTKTTLRWAFLDRRWCIESTIKLDYEKSQEEQLMLSILPKHIAHDVGIREEVQLMTRSKMSPSSRKPFDKLQVEMIRKSSVLYADIVNFTLLTAALSASSLISMLNEFFGKFNEAAKEYDCLRIKILGDCYAACLEYRTRPPPMLRILSEWDSR
ncbi:hypothetical protein DAPPUDRAFT_331098 [Daphnia pulex]|uniref:adenylate cyclase n=1 Tax=Daphnia pulex TaxID=6669 RepID=E9HLH2_DAPPU|nr:hypothetical protein DAPPUDRAFT_331098 [Daphnia pulex]|eukprot:EFX67346.1 hypothetical protein DAPPUDRAFT_331098 [Daphnia pulex]